MDLQIGGSVGRGLFDKLSASQRKMAFVAAGLLINAGEAVQREVMSFWSEDSRIRGFDDDDDDDDDAQFDPEWNLKLYKELCSSSLSTAILRELISALRLGGSRVESRDSQRKGEGGWLNVPESWAAAAVDWSAELLEPSIDRGQGGTERLMGATG
ncbi:hypothetical protein E4U33_001504, partial [Claviceps sp. LM78 group G4]